MTERLFLGMKNGKQLLRITPPGFDASDDASKCVFSSDGDYLRVHAVIDQLYTREGTYGSYYGTWGFTDLGYVPMFYYSVTHTTTNRVFFPNDLNPSTSEMVNGWQAICNRNRLWSWNNEPGGFVGNYRIRAIVFKNKATDYIVP